MAGTAVALRSADPTVVDAVRSVAALADLAIAVHPPGAAPPEAQLLIDSAAETRHDDPDWRDGAPRFVWVGVERAVAAPDGGRCLVLPDAAEEMLARMRAAGVRRRARVVGVVGARGGVGASSLAAVLARSCADVTLSVGLVDLDVDGGGIDVLMGIEHEPGLRWADLAGESGGFGGADLTSRLPAWRGVRVLSADLRAAPGARSEQVLAACTDAHDVVVLDLPRSATRERGEAARWCDVIVLLASCDVQSVAGAQVSARALAGLDARLVVRGPAPGDLQPAAIAAASGLPLVLAMPQERSMAAAVERGVAPGDHRRGPLARGGRRLVQSLGLDR